MAETNLLLAARATLLEPALTEAEIAALSLNPDGRLRVSSKPAYFAPSSGALTTSGTSLNVDVTDASNIILHMKNTGSASMSAGQFVFEGSIDSTDGVDGTWFVVQAVRSDSNTIETGRSTSSLAAGSAQAYAWELSVNALRWFRIRCSTTLTTNAIATWTVIRGSYATEPIPAIQAHPVTGSGSFTVTPAAGSAYSLVAAASTNAAVVKSSAGILTELSVFNPTAAVIYVKLFNKTTAPTVGTDVPVLVVPVAVNSSAILAFGVAGKRFSTGISIATTAGPLSTDSAAIAAGAIIHGTYI